MRDHGRIHGREEFDRLRVVLAYQPRDRRTSRGNKVAVLAGSKKRVVFRHYGVGADSGFFRFGEAEFFQRGAHYAEVGYGETRHERRRERNDDVRVGRNQFSHGFQSAVDVFRVSRAYVDAVPA